ncbi:hypothetical protein FKP32DRAFT_77223 [Trametes sanguinea]|nr:hypothetical protein FKP32DRAFT_77223 [Trametes sanguinea]
MPIADSPLNRCGRVPLAGRCTRTGTAGAAGIREALLRRALRMGLLASLAASFLSSLCRRSAGNYTGLLGGRERTAAGRARTGLRLGAVDTRRLPERMCCARTGSCGCFGGDLAGLWAVSQKGNE